MSTTTSTRSPRMAGRYSACRCGTIVPTGGALAAVERLGRGGRERERCRRRRGGSSSGGRGRRSPARTPALEDVVAAVPPSRLPADRALRRSRGPRPPRPRPEPAGLDRAAVRAARGGAGRGRAAGDRRGGPRAACARRGSRRGSSRTAAGRASSAASRRPDDDRPTLTIALDRLAGLRDLDERSGLATFGGGTVGPDVEAALAPHGLTLGHFPQSFERSTLGGWVATRSAGQQSLGFGRIEELFAGGRVETPAGSLEMPPIPRRPPARTCASSCSGRRAGSAIVTEATVRAVPKPGARGVPGLVPARTGRTRSRPRARSHRPACRSRWSARRRRSRRRRCSRSPAESRSPAARAATAPARRRTGTVPRARRGSGMERIVGAAVREAGSIVRRTAGRRRRVVGRHWVATRFRSPTSATAVGSGLRGRHARDRDRLDRCRTSRRRRSALRHGLDDVGERVHAFSHLSHVYPTGRASTRPTCSAARPTRTRRSTAGGAQGRGERGDRRPRRHDQPPARRRARPRAVSCRPRRESSGWTVLADVARRFDPDGIMNPGVLVERRERRPVTRRPGLTRPRDRRRDAERAGTRVRSARHAGRARPRPDRAIRLAAARLGRAGRRAVLALDRRGVRGPVGRRRRSAETIAAWRWHDPARHDRRHRRRRPAAPTGDRVARPAPDRGLPRDRRRSTGSRSARLASARRRRVPGRCEANWIRANEPDVWRQIRHYLFLSGFLIHRLTGRFVDSVAEPGRLHAVRLQALPLGEGGRLAVAAAPVDPAWLPELVPPTERSAT